MTSHSLANQSEQKAYGSHKTDEYRKSNGCCQFIEVNDLRGEVIEWRLWCIVFSFPVGREERIDALHP